MLTVEFDRLGLRPGDRVLDLGCGGGRHAFESLRLGAATVACDHDADALAEFAAVATAANDLGNAPDGDNAPDSDPDRALGSAPDSDPDRALDCAHDSAVGRSPDQAASWMAIRADARALPFADAGFDRIIASEVLEHIDEDEQAISELARVLRPGGTIAVTVPAFASERVCWALSSDYHAPAVPGGHVRVYRRDELVAKLGRAGLAVSDYHGAHGLHAPYWWLRCAVGPTNETNPLVTAYRRLLEHDIIHGSRATRAADRALSRVLPKSLVLYAHKPSSSASSARSRSPSARAGQVGATAGTPAP